MTRTVNLQASSFTSAAAWDLFIKTIDPSWKGTDIHDINIQITDLQIFLT